MKRTIDVIGAIAGLILLAPVLAVTAGAIGLVLGKPVLFRQERPGLHGRPFTLYKFRTLRAASDAADACLDDEERLGRFGKFLRSTSLDELPQLWNVLTGDMSLVGPRPLLMEYLPLYTPEQARRHDVKPGITGWAQINGRNAVEWNDKFQLDVWYVENRSLLLDLRILLATPKRVFTRRGVTQDGHATAEKFRGSEA